MAKLEIKMSGMKGLAPRFAGAIDGAGSQPRYTILGQEDQMAEGIWNPFRNYGYMTPISDPTEDVPSTITGDITFDTGSVDLMNSVAYDSVNDDLYFGSDGRYIFRMGALGDRNVDEEHDLGSTGTPRITDLEIYQVNGVQNIFYLYEKSGNMECGISTLPMPAAGEDDAWLTSSVSGAFTNSIVNDPFMRVADNGFMYIYQDNNIHKVDGTTDGGSDGTIIANVLQFPPYFAITDVLDTRGLQFIAIRGDTNVDPTGKFNSKIGVYIWDRQSTVIRTRDFVPLEGVRDIRRLFLSPSGRIRAIVSSSDGETQIRQYNGNNFSVIETVDEDAYPQVHDGLTTANNATIWLGADGKFYAYGSISGREEEHLYKLGDILNISSAGMIFYGNKSASDAYIYYSAKYSGGTGDVCRFWTPSLGTIAQGDIYTLVKYLPNMSTVRYIDVYCAPTSASTSVKIADIKVYFNQSLTAFKTQAVTREDASRGYVRIELNKPYVTAIQLEVEYNSGISLNTNDDFYPSTAIVDYEATGTKG